MYRQYCNLTDFPVPPTLYSLSSLASVDSTVDSDIEAFVLRRHRHRNIRTSMGKPHHRTQRNLVSGSLLLKTKPLQQKRVKFLSRGTIL